MRKKGGRNFWLLNLVILYLFVMFDHFYLKRNLIIIHDYINLFVLIYIFLVLFSFVVYSIYYYCYFKIVWDRNKKYWKKIMIGKLFDKLLGSTLGKGATIIGSIITVKWGGDMVGDFFDNRVKARKRNEAIDRIILTEEDKEYFKKMVEKKRADH